jgi:Na+-transporting NADH:ubiquinone oxidoreductase subunit C
VSAAAVFLRPLQMANKAMDQKVNILQVAGIWEDNLSIDEMFTSI